MASFLAFLSELFGEWAFLGGSDEEAEFGGGVFGFSLGAGFDFCLC